MSSRNRFLSATERATAPVLYRTLQDTISAVAGGVPVPEALATAQTTLTQAGLAVEYLALVDGPTLAPIDAPQPGARFIATARLGSVRLLDNIAAD